MQPIAQTSICLRRLYLAGGYCTAHIGGGITGIGILPVCLITITIWIIIEILMSQRESFYSLTGRGIYFLDSFYS